MYIVEKVIKFANSNVSNLTFFNKKVNFIKRIAMLFFKYIFIISSLFIINSSFAQENEESSSNLIENNSISKIEVILNEMDRLKKEREEIILRNNGCFKFRI